MSTRVSELGGKDLQFFMEDTYRTGDEIQVLAEGFADLSAKTLRYVDQVQKVTAEKERIGTELSMATAIQASQLPKLFPAFPTRSEFDIYASMTPAREVGGDFYDFFLIDPDHIALVMADVSGKGVPAALFMMIARVLIKSHLQNGQSVGEALANVNNQLCEGNEMGLFVTVWAAVIEISTGKGMAANAGHEHPALRRAGGQYELITYRHSLALAAMDGVPFKEHSFEMNPGDSLFVYTDGVAEATNAENELFGTERMLEALNTDPGASPKEVLAHVMDGINRFVAGAEQFDDITMLSFQYNGPSKEA
jgi:sigma-B regulation protein RsbU (phosphoserine phosphatase)